MEENTMVNTNNAVNAVKPVKEHRISTGGAVGIVSGVGAICAAIGWFGRMLWDKNKDRRAAKKDTKKLESKDVPAEGEVK